MQMSVLVQGRQTNRTKKLLKCVRIHTYYTSTTLQYNPTKTKQQLDDDDKRHTNVKVLMKGFLRVKVSECL